MKNFLVLGRPVYVINGPAKFDLMLGLFDNKILELTLLHGDQTIKVRFTAFIGTDKGFRDDNASHLYSIVILNDDGTINDKRLLLYDPRKRKGMIQTAGDQIIVSSLNRS